MVRHVVIFMTTLAAVLLYLDRVCVAIAAPYIREDLRLTQDQINSFLGAFFLSYAIVQVPAGWFSDRWGARLMMVLYILIWSLFTGLTGAAGSLLFLWLMRFGVGVAQAGAYPTAGGLISKWVPFSNRGFASSLVAFGGRIGGVLANVLTGVLIVMFVPLGVRATFDSADILNVGSLCAKIAPVDATTAKPPKVTAPSPAGRRVWSLLSQDVHPTIAAVADSYRKLQTAAASKSPEDEKRLAEFAADGTAVADITAALNGLVDGDALSRYHEFEGLDAAVEVNRLKKASDLSAAQRQRLNRLLLEAAFRESIRRLYVHGWRPVMVLYGAVSVLVAAAFWWSFRNRPEEHPRCNRAECALIAGSRPAGTVNPHGKAGTIPLRWLAASIDMWMNSIMQFTTNIGWVFLVTLLPRYLDDVHKVPLVEQGVMAATPLIMGWAGMLLGGKLTDVLVPFVGLRWGRCLPMAVTRFTAALGFALCLFFATMQPGSWASSPWMYIAAFSLMAFSTDMGNPALWAYVQDVAGRHSGSVLGWGNMWGNLGAFVAPHLYGFLLGETPSVADWNTMFAVCAVSFVISGICALGINANRVVIPPDAD